MSAVYDNWERLVEAVLKREQFKQLALCESFSSSISADLSSRSSFSSSLEDFSGSRISSNTIDPGAPSSTSSIPYREVQAIKFEEIKKATKNFQHDLIIGEGGFGRVYKGWIDERTLTASKPGSGKAVAVKKCRQDTFQGYKEWMKEIHYLSQLHHPNLVRLIGYCDKAENWILVYEFMPKGSLDNHLFRRGHQSLPWETRIKVAIGAARALSFLHDREIQVIHRGFKCGDILLDGEFNAKLSDFGLARDGPTGDMTHVSTRVMGTYGCAAPEYVATGHLTAKCDVYGFGVVLLELLSGRRALDANRATKEQNLMEWAKQYLGDKRKMLRIVDTTLEGQCTREAAYNVATLALRCVSLEPKRRPRMAEVLVALEQL
ncbi:Serine/threonine protein kinase [Handroanthus impetiginosus]|uniref:non-specific serine/threonine protein kinase n=1 Tax=Handroanthus impetiginosus TaxID=429701 RepID=A0A2G9HLN5_9LAMI|nr:Serine/threonine protein kinase [Handroanthus impetiginosus]